MAKELHKELPICDEKKLLRAAELCKADLASALVREFPNLQGKIGSIYANNQAEDPEVAQAIDEHWMPLKRRALSPQRNAVFC